jgi:glyoxylase-like metal-dependent hydrolase (beta-lactamase superfamily II)
MEPIHTSPDLMLEHPGPGHWVLFNEGINLNLIAGQERAMLLDSGFGTPGLRQRAEALCGLPVTLVHTHAHGDHTGGDGEWEEIWLHPAEWEDYRARQTGADPVLRPLEEGMRLDLGGRTLDVLHIPGHSPGSVAFWDRANRLLFPGDTVMTQPVFLFGPTSSVSDYIRSLERLADIAPHIDGVFPCHRQFPLKPQPAIADLLDCARRALRQDRETLIQFEVDLGVAVVRFEGYARNGFAVCTRELGPGQPQ